MSDLAVQSVSGELVVANIGGSFTGDFCFFFTILHPVSPVANGVYLGLAGVSNTVGGSERTGFYLFACAQDDPDFPNGTVVEYKTGSSSGGNSTSDTEIVSNATVSSQWVHYCFTYDHATGQQSLYALQEGFSPSSPAFLQTPTFLGTMTGWAPVNFFVFADDPAGNDLAVGITMARCLVAPFKPTQAQIIAQFQQRAPTAALIAAGAYANLTLDDHTAPTHDSGSGGFTWTTVGTGGFTGVGSQPVEWMPVVNAGFKSAQLPAQFALPIGFIAPPNFGAGTALRSPAISLFQAREVAASATSAAALFAPTPQAVAAFATITIIASGFGATPQASTSLVGSGVATTSVAMSPVAASSLVGAESLASMAAATPQSAVVASGAEVATTAMVASPGTSPALVGAEVVASSLTFTPLASPSLGGSGVVTGATSATAQASSTLAGSGTATSTINPAPVATLSLVGTGIETATLAAAPVSSVALQSAGGAAATLAPTPQATATLAGSETAASALSIAPQSTSLLTTAESVASVVASAPVAATSLIGAETRASILTAAPQSAASLVGAGVITGVATGAPQAVPSLLTSGGVGGGMVSAPTVSSSFAGAETATSSVSAAPSVSLSLLTAEQIASVLSATPSVIAALFGAEVATGGLVTTPQSNSALATQTSTSGQLTATPGIVAAVDSNVSIACSFFSSGVAALSGIAASSLASSFSCLPSALLSWSTQLPFVPGDIEHTGPIFDCSSKYRMAPIFNRNSSF